LEVVRLTVHCCYCIEQYVSALAEELGVVAAVAAAEGEGMSSFGSTRGWDLADAGGLADDHYCSSEAGEHEDDEDMY
jgi:hypothetical protein